MIETKQEEEGMEIAYKECLNHCRDCLKGEGYGKNHTYSSFN